MSISKNKVSNFKLGNGETTRSFEVHQGKLFKIKFIDEGFNGIIKFKNKIIDDKNKILEEVCWKKEKKNISKSE